MARPRKQTYTLGMYLDKIKDGDICNDGDVQRHMVWTSEQISELIITVLTDDYIPPIILGEEEYGTQLHIADGGCRSSALLMFRDMNQRISSIVENPIIKYKKKIQDENGNTRWEDAEFNIKNKTFEKLPPELQKKFNEYQIETVIHENCDNHMVSKYIKRYNNHISMNISQKAFTYIDNYARDIRKIIEDRFFVDYSTFTENEKIKGVVERVVIESVMCMNHFDEWNRKTKRNCDYLNKNASKDEFEKLDGYLHRLENVITDDVKDMFNSKDAFILLTLFDKFTKFELEDKKYINFLREFKNNYRQNRRSCNGMLFDEIDKNRGTKDKQVITEKMDMLESLMKEFLHIVDTNENTEINIVDFISENVGIESEEVNSDLDCYEMTLNDLEDRYIRLDSKLRNEKNRPSLLAIVAYSYKNDIDLEKWLEDYAKVNNTYHVDQKTNFKHMKKNLEKYIERVGE